MINGSFKYPEIRFFGYLPKRIMGDAQARRLHIRIKGKDGKTYLAHTLNNTCVAPPRMLIAFLENHLPVSYTHLTRWRAFRS